MNLTHKEVKAVLEKAVDGRDLAPDMCADIYKSPRGWEISKEEEEGGVEGAGEKYWAVFCVKRKSDSATAYVKFEGSYSSYDGLGFYRKNEFKLVEPRMVSVRQWFDLEKKV